MTTTTETNEPQTTFLLSDESMSEGTLEGVRATLFEVLLKLTQGRVEHYLSDLYHDAIWLKEQVSGPTVFFYGLRDSGTDLSDDEAHVRIINKKVWRVELTRSNIGRWSATTTRLP